MRSRIRPYADELLEILAPGFVFFDPEVLATYSQDAGEPPRQLERLAQRRPDAVVIPRSEDQVVRLMRLATAAKIPVTPRGAGTSRNGETLPLRGGILLDTTRLTDPVDPIEGPRTVTVACGMRVWELELALRAHGLGLMTYPWTAPSATVGGYVCGPGIGLGAQRHGPIRDQVEAVRMVLPDGTIRTLMGQDLELVVGCNGTTGVATRVTLRIAPQQPKEPVVVFFDQAADATRFLQSADKRLRPWQSAFRNPTFSRWREAAGGPSTVPGGKYAVLLIFLGSERDAVENDLRALVQSNHGQLLADHAAIVEWNEAFRPLRAQALGPGLGAGEVIVPLHRLARFVQRVEALFGTDAIALDAAPVRGDHAKVLGFTLEDHRSTSRPGLRVALRMLSLAKDLGGRIEAPGAYFAAENPHVLGHRRLRHILAFKASVDKAGIMNPGKLKSVRVRAAALRSGMLPVTTLSEVLSGPAARWASMRASGRDKTHIGAEKEHDGTVSPGHVKALPVAAPSFPQWALQQVHACSRSGYCNLQSPVANAVGFEFGTPRGLTILIRGVLESELLVTKKVEDVVAAASEAELGEAACPSGIPLNRLARDFRAHLEAKLGRPLVVPPELARILESEPVERDGRQDAGTPGPL